MQELFSEVTSLISTFRLSSQLGVGGLHVYVYNQPCAPYPPIPSPFFPISSYGSHSRPQLTDSQREKKREQNMTLLQMFEGDFCPPPPTWQSFSRALQWKTVLCKHCFMQAYRLNSLYDEPPTNPFTLMLLDNKMSSCCLFLTQHSTGHYSVFIYEGFFFF